MKRVLPSRIFHPETNDSWDYGDAIWELADFNGDHEIPPEDLDGCYFLDIT